MAGAVVACENSRPSSLPARVALRAVGGMFTGQSFNIQFSSKYFHKLSLQHDTNERPSAIQEKELKWILFNFFELLFVRVYWQILVLIIIFWIQFFIAVKHLQVFWRSCFNNSTLEIFLSLEHYSCCSLSAPHFVKLNGSRQIQDIHWMKGIFYQVFVITSSVFCTFIFLLKIGKCEALLSPRVWNKRFWF